MIVIDASVALAWSLKDEGGDYAESVMQVVIRDGAMAPAHWPLEVANALRSAERRGRIAAELVDEVGRALADLAIDIRPVEVTTSFWGVLSAARDYGLSVYDAAYLDLSRSRGLSLATLDGELRDACQKAGVTVFG